VTGKVFLIGAGPGDPGLITIKGLVHLKEADVVVYDRLLDESLLEATPSSAERIFVGKERGRQALTQDEINNLLVQKALDGHIVVRLKGGDPFVFGRGGEEALELKQNNIPFEVIPGITSAIAAAAYAGVPITQRQVATCFTVVSGSEDPSKPESSIPWDVLAKTGGTLAILMGWAALPSIMKTLQDNGLSPDTPVALVQWGTWNKQRTVTGTVQTIARIGVERGLKPPVIAIVGDVVNLRESLQWFDNRPLFGKKILITRSRVQSSNLVISLESLGVETIEVPSIEINPLDDYNAVDTELVSLDYSWIIFASTNAVEVVFDRMKILGQDTRSLSGITIGAIGQATAAVLNNYGIAPDFISSRSVSEEVLEELSTRAWQNQRVLLPSSDIGRNILETGLKELGAVTNRIAVYKTSRPVGIEDQARQAIRSGLDLITFTSSSTVKNLLDILGDNKQYLEDIPIACIGPITADTAIQLGLKVELVADVHTVEGLVESITSYFQRQES
jgi:uroporphyrinogen III methyltransferase/synthase